MPSLREDEILTKAKALEREYNWLGAKELYEEALLAIEEEDLLRRGEVGERIGYCYFWASRQAQNQQEATERMRRAAEACEKAYGFYERMADEQKAARLFRCRSAANYFGHWLTSDPSARRKCIIECLELQGKALASFSESGEMLEYGKTYGQLVFFPFWLAYIQRQEDLRPTVKFFLEKGIEWGERAIAALSELGSLTELGRAYLTLIVCLFYLGGPRYVVDQEERDKLNSKAVRYLSKFEDLSKKTGDAMLLAYSHKLLGPSSKGEEAVMHLEKSAEYGRRTGHKPLIADSLDAIAYHTHWKANATEDPVKRRELAEKAMRYYDEAQSCYSILLPIDRFKGDLLFPLTGYADHYLALSTWETNTERRLDFLEKAKEAGMEALKSAEGSNIPVKVATCLHAVSEILEARAILEPDSAERRGWLEEALKYLERAIKLGQQHEPFAYWQLGVMHNRLAEIYARLADMEPDPNSRLRLLEEAVSTREKGLYLSSLMTPQDVIPCHPIGEVRYAISMQRDKDNYATLLIHMYDLTNKQEHLRKAIEASEKAVESATKLDLVSLKAESYWRIAKAKDTLGERLKAAESFECASDSYMQAARKISQLSSFYSDYASYMKAWAELERSRHEHESENYAQSQEHYRMCSRLLGMTKKWSYLSSYYHAWSLLERGEELSGLERPPEAMNAFDEASRVFGESANGLRGKIRELDSSEERDEASKLAAVAGLRSQYCTGRVLMEEAKLYTEKGDRISSAAKYSNASQIFEEIWPNLENEEARSELRFASTLCRAWENMELAEEKDDTSLYRKAAEQFSNAGKISRRKTGKMIAFGNSCFCEALELGLQFMQTSNTDFYSRAKLRMEHAARYYYKAGLEKYALWVDATKRLFDAHVYAGKAEAETEPETRSRYYLMAEKCLELSAGLYQKGGFQQKKNEALRSLGRMRKEHELALSLKEVLTAPNVLSSTTGVSMPDSTEKAAGLNNFESVYIKAHLSAPTEFVPSEEFPIKLDLINVGKKPGLLVRVEGLAPSKCKVLDVPSYCSLVDDSLDVKGVMLRPLSVESIGIRVQITDMVSVNISPRVVYVDELGNFRTIGVGEVNILPVIEFESKAAQSVFTYLANAFEEDSTKRRLASENSGWRSLPQIIGGANVSKRSLYGTSGSLGTVLSELHRKGLIGLRVFRGRGRGGHILRVRIHVERDLIRRYLIKSAPNALL